ncbi:hypothetical protein RJ640_004969 [Escallonia rubra]|uniref:Peptidase A1 domain-containing protein n=1 Tax=Escallonia rubra TaxID=112253 RepID=A0AA88QUH7_9ASTE|nr:hypothetical protein RJ640_004969 [Escallonia rubra]
MTFMAKRGGSWSSTSVATQVSDKFSYCIGNISDPEYTYDLLILGDSAIMNGSSTQLDVYNKFYYLTLQGISFGGIQLEIDPEVFQRNEEGDGGVIIDSGRTMTSLVGDAFRPLKDQVTAYIDGLKLEKANENPLCYKGIVSQDLKDFPKVTFHFAGADLELSAANMFLMIDVGTFCLFMEELDGDTPGYASMIWVVMQQYFNVAYDLKAKTLSFLSIDCLVLSVLRIN